MATIDELPQHRVRNQAYERAKQTLSVVRSMRHGGTANCVREAVIDLTGESVSIGPIKSALWHLHDLGHVVCEERNNTRWWSFNKANADESSLSTAR